MSQTELDNGDRTFHYTYCAGKNKPTIDIKLPVNVSKLKNVPELVARVMNFHNIPCFLEKEFCDSLSDFALHEKTNLQHNQAQTALDAIRKDPSLIDTIAGAVAKKYEQTWAKHHKPNSSKLNEFSLSYHYLIHSPAVSVLLKLEKKYLGIMAKFLSDKESSIVKMQQRQQMEMTRACEHVGFAYTANDVTILASKHLADIERLQSHWKNETEQITTSQKREFSELVVGLHKEMLANNNKINTNGPIYLCVQQVLDSSHVKQSYIPDDSLFLSAITSSSSTAPIKKSGSGATISSMGGASSGIVMEESFTVNLGAQLKTMHNIRLLVTDILNFCRYSGDDEMDAQRFQTAMSLYSNSLSAVVLLSDKRIGRSTGIEQEFSSICNASSEFHFPPLEEQLDDIRKLVTETKINDAESDNVAEDSENVELTEGEFYVTKHSNLSQVHVVFHVVADESYLQSKVSMMNVTSRHPVVLALRHILKVASNHDIRTLTVPLLLTRELTEEITFQWCVKRAELVMKCMKGFMMEMATWDGGLSRNINFVVPPGVSEEAFDRLRSALPEVFRTTSTRNLTPAHRRPNAKQ